MSSPNSTAKTFLVAAMLCIVCSSLVSSTATFLKEAQERNKVLDKKRNILMCAGLIKDGASAGDIEAAFEKITPIVVDLETGQEVKDIDPKTYNQRDAVKDPNLSIDIPAEIDKNKIKKRVKASIVYLVKEDNAIEQLILPVHGKGLWSTLYGFLALDKDTKTVKGFAYYEHAETPGLGGEVDNKRWKQQWVNKKVYNDKWEPAIDIVKGAVDPNNANAVYQIDGLAGATITSNGVEDSLRYWLGSHGFLPFLENFRKQGVQ